MFSLLSEPNYLLRTFKINKICCSFNFIRYIKCPICREDHSLPSNGIQGFPTNRMIQNLIDEINGKQHHSTIYPSLVEEPGLSIKPTAPQLPNNEPSAPTLQEIQELTANVRNEMRNEMESQIQNDWVMVQEEYTKNQTDIMSKKDIEKYVHTILLEIFSWINIEYVHNCNVFRKGFL